MPTRRAIQAAMLALLRERGAATACPSEVARRIGGADWRTLMPEVREVAAALQARGRVDVYQRGRPVDLRRARGPVRLRAHDAGTVDHRAEPHRYAIGRGEEGVLTVEPYKSELLPLWAFRTPDIARRSARDLYRAFVAYGRAGDFVGMDMARKFLQMGWTRARRYANHRSGRKYAPGRVRLPDDPSATKAESAAIFRAALDRALANRTYQRLRAAHAGRGALVSASQRRAPGSSTSRRPA